MRKTLLFVAYLAGVVAIATPIAIALNITDTQTLRLQQEQARQLAGHALELNQQITGQVFQAINELEAAGLASAPCSPAARRKMSEVFVRASRLQAVGYVQNDRLLCSSLGEILEPVDIGPAEYVSPNGLAVRTARRLPMGHQDLYRISTSAKSGFAAIVHTENAFVMSPTGADGGLGIIGTSNMRPITHTGLWDAAWAKRLGQASEVGFVDRDHVVALVRSPRYAYFAYAAIPTSRSAQDWWNHAKYLIPTALGSGLLLIASIVLVTRQQLSLAGQLRLALKRDELYMVYQPIVDLESGHWVGAEALVRWRTREGREISPAVFIPEAESRGMMGLVTTAVLQRVRRDTTQMLHKQRDFFLSVNLSSQDINDPKVLALLAQWVDEDRLDPSRIHVEVTERTFVDEKTARHGLEQLRAIGVGVAIDDFGTGYSSLSYLTKLKPDALKIDKSFVDTIGTDAVTASVIEHIIEMAKSMRLSMIAEGVETPEQLHYLRTRGVPLAQGWLFAKGMDTLTLSAHLARPSAGLPGVATPTG